MEKNNALTLMLVLLLGFLLLFPSQCLSSIINPVGLASFRFSNHTDEQSLVAFKSYITSDPQRVLHTWNSSVPFCSWRGVTCNVLKQRVTGLDLDSLGLVGTIAPHLGNLSFLHNLDLQNNSFAGGIPPEIGNLFRLKRLTLCLNNLKGPIPTSLGFSKQLSLLALCANNLEGIIPSELGKLSKLTSLFLWRNNLGGPIPHSLGNLSSLQAIDLQENRLTGSIPEGLGHLPLLLNISLGENELEGEIPPSIFNMSSLTMLDLDDNRMSGTLPHDMFSKLSNSAEAFYLDANHFSGPLPVSLANASDLIVVDFSFNNFTGHVPLLWNLPKLQRLILSNNELVTDGEHGWDFLTSLTNSTQLQFFSLHHNLATGKVPSSVGNLSRCLSKFYISENRIEGSLPAEISNLVSLSVLSVHTNSFSGNIPPSLGKLTNLEDLFLQYNNFSAEIPGSLGNLTVLSDMRLYANYLTGTIPSTFGNLQRLEVLGLLNNMLNGTIPVDIFSITNINYLDLSFNFLSGHIPHQIGKLKMTSSITLSHNHLTGDIPSSIGGCSSLDSLYLDHNSLHGQIPSAIGDMKGIEFIDLSSNNLSGEIPISLNSLHSLQKLNLSMNQLEGIVPSMGAFANATIVSLFGNHQLCGGIPKFNLPKCNLPDTKHAKRSRSKMIIGLVIGLVAPFTLIIGALIFLLSRRRRQHNTPTVDLDNGFPHEYKLYSYHELKSATQNFSSQNLLGQGSFGSVYKAIFTDGTIAAIKVFNLALQKGSKSFLVECEALRNVRHRNLVKIISVCSTEDFKALILPFMSKGSLDQWLHKINELDNEVVGGLDLRQRLIIAKEVAIALEYLHHECETPIVHCDLKPSNVLLDIDMCAHVADFGIARILDAPDKHPTSSTLGLKGSFGYIAPEYGISRGVSTKGDVYSYGILVLEMFTGKRPTDDSFTDESDLKGWVAKGLTNNVADILDHNLAKNGLGANQKAESVIASTIELGLKCASISPEARPTMRDVSLLIRKIIAQLPT